MPESKKLIRAWSNDAKRQAFLQDYREWGVWLTTPELELTYYRYQLPGGAVIIAMEHKRHVYAGYKQKDTWEPGVNYYLQKPGEPFSPTSRMSISAVAALLMETKITLQKQLSGMEENV